MSSVLRWPCQSFAGPIIAASLAVTLSLGVVPSFVRKQRKLRFRLVNRNQTKVQKDAAQEPPQNPFPEAIKVPDGILEGGTAWLNTDQPIDLKDLKGKIVVLDFWTYCCINCMHVLPDLKFLEEKYPNQLVVIGVHSAKFDNEKVSESIRDAIMRYEIKHPVVNDSEMVIWRKFGTQAWPTLALIDPEGNYCGSQSGEGNRELFDNVIGKLIDYHRAREP